MARKNCIRYFILLKFLFTHFNTDFIKFFLVISKIEDKISKIKKKLWERWGRRDFWFRYSYLHKNNENQSSAYTNRSGLPKKKAFGHRFVLVDDYLDSDGKTILSIDISDK